ncbi:hypothetical protein COCNU_scaffold007709G000010 [Cocos nucifera]|nr:hypothetical protein [Cocos nucifera]
MNVARLNMCHNTTEWHREVIEAIKRLNQEKGFCIGVMIDTEGSQMHMVGHGSASSIKAKDGSVWLFTTNKFEGSRPFTIQVNFEGFSEGILAGDEIVIDGGMATFEVIEKVGNDLRCKCTDPGLLLPRAKLSFWRDGKLVEMNSGIPTLSTKDWADIEFGISEGVDYIAVSFVKDVNDITNLKSYLSTRSSELIKVLAKIESLESLKNLEAIVKASDGIMVARGDLGVQIPLEQIPTIQQEVTYLCRQLSKPVIVASQLLESMVEYPTPTRAEVADVSEAVRQQADALMLSGESAVGSFAEKALSVLCMASGRMELWSREENRQNLLFLPQLAETLSDQIAEQICNCAVEMADNLGVDAIFVYTKHGHMASLLSRNRPNPPIFAFTDNANARKGMNLHWGVTPLEFPLSDVMEDNFKQTTSLMKNRGACTHHLRLIKVLAKIESLESLKNLEAIVKASDGIMVARGDLGVQIPLEQIPTIQQEVTYLCRQLSKPVIVASQLLESMVEYPTPTRAEVADVSEAVRQQADALMLSGESAVGSFAEKALSVLCMASGRMELWSREENRQNLLFLPQLAETLSDQIAEQICNCAVEMADNLGVDAIFVYTKHGHMASLLSRNRPNPPIFAFTDNANARKGMNLHWGVTPLEFPLSDVMEDNFKQTTSLMKNRGTVRPGDMILVVSDSDVSCSSVRPSVSQSIQVRTID